MVVHDFTALPASSCIFFVQIALWLIALCVQVWPDPLSPSLKRALKQSEHFEWGNHGHCSHCCSMSFIPITYINQEHMVILKHKSTHQLLGIPAVCRQLLHQKLTRSHHKQCPKSHSSKPRHVPHRSLLHSLAWCLHLYMVLWWEKISILEFNKVCI